MNQKKKRHGWTYTDCGIAGDLSWCGQPLARALRLLDAVVLQSERKRP